MRTENEKGADNSTHDLSENHNKDTEIKYNHLKISNNEDGLIKKKEAKEKLYNIISLLPNEIKSLIENAFIYKRIPKEYLLSSILYAFSNASGLAFKITCLNYTNYANLYFAIIGSRGDVKSPAMKLATKSLHDYDSKQNEIYKKDKRDYDSNPENQNKYESPVRKQLFLQDATIESAMYTHLKNPYSVGIFVDELSGLLEKMANKNSHEGAIWKTFLLQGNTNAHIDVSRKTTDSYRIEKSYPTLIGSLQHQFISKMFSNGNLESGLIDRILFTTNITKNNKIEINKMPDYLYENYSNSLNNLLEERKALELNNKEYHLEIEKEGEALLHSYSQNLLDKQEESPDLIYEYISKMRINVLKITLLVHLIKNSNHKTFTNKISFKSAELAIIITDFYLNNFELIIKNQNSGISKKEFTNELINRSIENNIPQKTIIKLTGYSKGQISKLYKKAKETGNWKLETDNPKTLINTK